MMKLNIYLLSYLYSIWHGLRTVARKEGPLALFRGLWPTMLGVFPYIGIDFAIYETLKHSRFCPRVPGSDQRTVLGTTSVPSAVSCHWRRCRRSTSLRRRCRSRLTNRGISARISSSTSAGAGIWRYVPYSIWFIVVWFHTFICIQSHIIQWCRCWLRISRWGLQRLTYNGPKGMAYQSFAFVCRLLTTRRDCLIGGVQRALLRSFRQLYEGCALDWNWIRGVRTHETPSRCFIGWQLLATINCIDCPFICLQDHHI